MLAVAMEPDQSERRVTKQSVEKQKNLQTLLVPLFQWAQTAIQWSKKLVPTRRWELDNTCRSSDRPVCSNHKYTCKNNWKTIERETGAYHSMAMRVLVQTRNDKVWIACTSETMRFFGKNKQKKKNTEKISHRCPPSRQRNHTLLDSSRICLATTTPTPLNKQ